MSNPPFHPRHPVRQRPNAAGGLTWMRELDFESTAEPFTIYALMDGGQIRVRLSVHRIFQVTDEEGTPLYNPDGSRSLFVESHSTVISVE